MGRERALSALFTRLKEPHIRHIIEYKITHHKKKGVYIIDTRIDILWWLNTLRVLELLSRGSKLLGCCSAFTTDGGPFAAAAEGPWLLAIAWLPPFTLLNYQPLVLSSSSNSPLLEESRFYAFLKLQIVDAKDRRC